nr:MAG TPA: hypothetical protein [Microviridae sp.]DAW85624.1 MAG TPA: hypothetical protein [Microviridae sp.]
MIEWERRLKSGLSVSGKFENGAAVRFLIPVSA